MGESSFQSDEFRRTAPIPQLFCKYAVPGVIGILLMGMQTVVDGIILGNFAGAEALAGVNLALPFFSFIVALSVVLGVGCQTIVSVCMGRMDRHGADNALASGFWALAGISTVSAGLLLIFGPRLICYMGAEGDLLREALAYMQTLLPFFPFIAVMFFCDYMLKAMGRTFLSMGIITLIVSLNIGFDLLFIAVFGWGTWGAGLGTGMAFFAGMLLALPGIWGRGNMISVLRGKWRWKLVGRMLYNGASEGFSELSTGITALLFNIAVIKYMGIDGLTALAVVNYVLFIGVMIFLGISDGIIPVISYNHGAGLRDRIREVFRLAVKVNVVIGLVVCVVLSLFGERIILLFFREGNTASVQIAVGGLACYAVAFLINGFNILSSSFFTAIENAKTSIVVSLSRSLLFSSVGILLFPLLFGSQGIWLAVPVAELCTFLAALILLKRSRILSDVSARARGKGLPGIVTREEVNL